MPKVVSTPTDETFLAQFNALQADVIALRTAYQALLAKMDADFADVTNASVDYVASVSAAAVTSDSVQLLDGIPGEDAPAAPQVPEHESNPRLG